MDTTAKLNQIFQDSSTKAEAYENMLKYLHSAVNNIEIDYNLDFREKYKIDLENPMRFDDTFFECNGYDEFYILYAAKLNDEVFKALEHAYNLTHDDKYTKEILENRISVLSETSTPNLPDYYNTMDNEGKNLMYKMKVYDIDNKRAFEIKNASANKISSDEYEINLFIDYYDFFGEFSVRTSKIKEVEDAEKMFPPKSNDLLYSIVEDDVIGEISAEYHSYHDKQNDKEQNTLDKITNLSESQKDSPNLYKDLMIFIRDQANEYLPEWTSYYTITYQKRDANQDVQEINNEFFEDDNSAELFALLFANQNHYVYEWVEFAWNRTHKEKFSNDILNRELGLLTDRRT